MDRRFLEFNRSKESSIKQQQLQQQEQQQEQTALWKLLVQQEIPPAANVGVHATDWLPDYAGFSWIAYGAGSKLVVRIAPSRGDFQQVLDTSSVQVPLGDPAVLLVSWCASRLNNVAHVAAAAGNVIYVYVPRTLGSSSGETPTLPLEWEYARLIAHSDHPVAHFSWTGCGDGILSSAGSEVFMWKQGTAGFDPVWKSQCQCPQSMVASTFSYRGLAASADARAESEKQKGRGTVWWWDEGAELQEGELSHPRDVLEIQWRPVPEIFTDLDELHQKHRPVLLTLCKDGVVRLWLEIDSGKSRSDKHLGKQVPQRSLKPAFFVSALIDVNNTLHVSLGVDFVVTWASETVATDSTYTRDALPCEWLVGIGPRGSIALWSLHCLDDVNPSRCPRVLLWKQGTYLTNEEIVPSMFKAIIRRPQSSVPPAAVEFFQAYCGAACIRWSRVWPPVFAISGDGSIMNSLDTISSCSSTWGCTSEDFDTGGHTGDQLNLALHPSKTTSMAATADSRGMVLLWYTGPQPLVEIPSLHSCAWTLSGRIIGDRMLPALCWSPTQLAGHKLILFVSQSEDIHCYLVSPDMRVKGKRWFVHVLLHKLQVSAPPVKDLWCRFHDGTTSFVAAASVEKSIFLWRIEVNPEEEPSADKHVSVQVSSCQTGLQAGKILTAGCYFKEACPYDITTGSEDGSIQMWRMGISNEVADWKCVGELQADSAPVKLVAVSDFGTRIASYSCSKAEHAVRLWEIMVGTGNYRYTPTGNIFLSEPAAAISWFESGSGHLLLAVLVGVHVQIYVEGRKEDWQVSSWACLASVSLPSPPTGLVWGTQGALYVFAGTRVFVLSSWVRSSRSRAPNTEAKMETKMVLEAAHCLARPLPDHHPRFILSLLMRGDQVHARACLRYLLLHADEDMASFPPLKLSSIQKPAAANESVKMWEFGKPLDSSEAFRPAGNISGGPLTAIESEQLTAVVKASSDEQQLVAVIKLLQEFDQSFQFSSLDRPGQRFALGVRYRQKLNPYEEVSADAKSMAWALQSDCKDTLISMLLPDSLSWPAFRLLGAGYWFTDIGKLKSRMEKLARAQFLVKRDPKDCTLLYVALDRRTLLSGLFKVSHDERDRPLVEFLARNFQDEKHKAAALKNAYVLMGKHRHELAAAFFLLGGDLHSAVSVCIRNLGDPQLGLVLCRLVDGSTGETEKEFIRSDLLPEQDKWLASLLQCLLADRLESVYELTGKEEDSDTCSLLDFDMGDYCTTVLSRARTTPVFVSRRLLQISMLSWRKYGFPLQAAEIVCKGLSASDSLKVSDKLISSEASWISWALAESVAKRSLEELVLQYLTQFVHFHPLWRHADAEVQDDEFLQELSVLEKKISFDLPTIVSSLANMAWHCGRPSFACWLLKSSEKFFKENI